MAQGADQAFVHLRVRTAYSLLEGAIKAGEVASLAAKAEMPAVALTDRANLFGALEFAQAATSKGIQPIMGCQLWLSRAASGEARDDLVGDQAVTLGDNPRRGVALTVGKRCRQTARVSRVHA